MLEIGIAIAVLISIAGALIMGVAAVSLWRRVRRRRALLRCFMHGVAEGWLRVKCRRNKNIFGEGFTDEHRGTSGALPFRLSARLEPGRDHMVTLGLFDKNDAQGEPLYSRWHLAWPKDRSTVIGQAYEAIRDASQFQSLTEASR